jgi:hypothetical protein
MVTLLSKSNKTIYKFNLSFPKYTPLSNPQKGTEMRGKFHSIRSSTLPMTKEISLFSIDGLLYVTWNKGLSSARKDCLTMIDRIQKIVQLEALIDSALKEREMEGALDAALEVYMRAEEELLNLKLQNNQDAERERQRLLAYCLLRQGNVQRQLGNPEAATKLGRREVKAARASGDEITLARSLMSLGTNRILIGKVDTGMELIIEARKLFQNGDRHEYRQGLGWSWILQADLGNAGVVVMGSREILDAADRALAILEPIGNWPGVARAHAARAAAMDDKDEAEEARREQKRFEEMGLNGGG